jgi:hypothetical protein
MDELNLMVGESANVPPQSNLPNPFALRQAILVLVVSLLAIGGGAWLLLASMENFLSAGWPRTEGVVESMQVMEKKGTKSGTQYLANVRYKFTLNGVLYQGDRFNTRGDYLASEQVATAVSKQYQQGGKCSVAYNPSNPERSILDTTLTYHTWGRAGIGAVLGVGGLVLLVLGIRDLMRARRNAAIGSRHSNG